MVNFDGFEKEDFTYDLGVLAGLEDFPTRQVRGEPVRLAAGRPALPLSAHARAGKGRRSRIRKSKRHPTTCQCRRCGRVLDWDGDTSLRKRGIGHDDEHDRSGRVLCNICRNEPDAPVRLFIADFVPLRSSRIRWVLRQRMTKELRALFTEAVDLFIEQLRETMRTGFDPVMLSHLQRWYTKHRGPPSRQAGCISNRELMTVHTLWRYARHLVSAKQYTEMHRILLESAHNARMPIRRLRCLFVALQMEERFVAPISGKIRSHISRLPNRHDRSFPRRSTSSSEPTT